jgi:uncharacterized protein (TIGR00297 family)
MIVLGILVNLLLALAALKKQAVTISGAVTGFFIGFLIFAGLGWGGWLSLVAFFVSSSLLSRLGRNQKAALDLAAIHEKGDQRDWVQALANGGPAALLSLVYWATGNPAWALGAVVSLSAANADTWASEIGVLSTKPPVSILSGKILIPGASGGVSPLGLAGSLAGGLLIGLTALGFSFSWGIPTPVLVVIAGSLGGFAGSLVDSFLGAAIQRQYESPAGKLTERPIGPQGLNRLVRGISFFGNDAVNLAANSLVSLTSVGIFSGL